jgi:hypothetical protein
MRPDIDLASVLRSFGKKVRVVLTPPLFIQLEFEPDDAVYE